MIDIEKTGGPAHPTNNWQKLVPQSTGYHEGMTLRDYFAAKAMQTLLRTANGAVGVNLYEHRVAETAYVIADAMLKARQK